MPAKNKPTAAHIAPWSNVPAHASLLERVAALGHEARELLYLTREEALDIIRELDDEILDVRSVLVEFDDDDDVDGGYVATWTAEVLIGQRWYTATVPDHYAEGAEIDWSESEAA